MTLDVTFRVYKGVNGTQSTTKTVACENITWEIDNKGLILTPATFRILEDVLVNEKLPAFIVWFGKCVEIITFELRFDTDTDYKDFRSFVKTSSFFTHSHAGDDVAKGRFTEFYWGESGDPFYTGQNNQDQLDEYRGMFLKSNCSKDVKGGFWRGTVSFAIGVVVSL
jgi:hypothetical protein